jgi:Cu(I)/Ag(I) efflux system membrane fusion protein
MNGMDMSQTKGNTQNINLSSLLKPTNGFVISSIPTTTISTIEIRPTINALGRIAYDTRQIGVISSRVEGRIDKLYISYRYQKIRKGQKIMDIYSPEILTNEENLLFLLKNDPSNTSLIKASKERLQLSGMSNSQLQQIISSHKPINAITIFSNYDGHIHEAGMDNNNMISSTTGMLKDLSLTTEPLSIREGMYVQKGQEIFSIYNPAKAWVLLNIYSDNQEAVKFGNVVHIICETAPGKDFDGKIEFIEPFYRKDSKTLTVRIPFDNSALQIPIGSQVKATISASVRKATVLPASSVVSLGLDRIVFRKENDGFKAQKVSVGDTYNNRIEILSGLSIRDSVAVNAQFLMDSESFIKINE